MRFLPPTLPCLILPITLLAGTCPKLQSADALVRSSPVLYKNNFEKATVDQTPPDFLVLDGSFRVKEEDQNRFLELPGSPLDTFGVLFGPTEKTGVRVSARVFATAKGRRQPAFAVGLGGVSGFKLIVSPAKRALEISRFDETKATVSFPWKTGAWTHLALQVRSEKENLWIIEGKAWGEGEAEPPNWTVTFHETSAFPGGRAGIWGMPYSGTAIRFDDLEVLRLAESPKPSQK